MGTRCLRLFACLGAGFLLTAGLAACEGALVIPSGAQTVHATVTHGSVRLEPAIVHAGMVYITVDSDGAELVIIGGGGAGPAGLTGLTDERLDAVVHGDLASTYVGSGFRSGGELGNASELGELSAGKFLFLPDGIVALEPGAYDSIPLDATAVLEVVP